MSNLLKFSQRREPIEGVEGLYARKMSLTQRQQIIDLYRVDSVDHNRAMVDVIILGVVDDAGSPAFTVDDAAALMSEADADLLAACYNRVIEYNGMAARAVEDAEKNS